LLACSLLTDLDALRSGAATDAGSVDAASDAWDASDAGACGSNPLDFGGCGCTQPNALRDCWLGQPGDASPCKPGVQRCGADAAGVWGACTGATAPSPEVCFDGVDDNCNGTVDDGCLCSASFPSCMSEDGGAAADPTWRLFPSVPVVNMPVQVVMVTKQAVSGAGAMFGNFCMGSPTKSCDVGTKCSGWNAIRYEWTPTTSGSYKVTFFLDDQVSGPCTGTTKVSTTVIVP
jgi:hypothetical protein